MRSTRKLLALLLGLCILLCTACGGADPNTESSSTTESSVVSESSTSVSEESESSAEESSDTGEIPIQTDYSACFADLSLTAEHAAVYDPFLDSVLFSQGDLQERIYPASITKLYTALVALEILSPETVVTVGKELLLVQPHSSLAYLARGQKLTVEMLVEGMLLPSGNDAAYVLAAAAGKALLQDENAKPADAVSAFVSQMNVRVARDGLENTHFTAPDGFHDPQHYTCVSDLLRIALMALENPVIAKFASTEEERVTFASGESAHWKNSNLLIRPDSPYYRPNVIGLKTGFTDEAGCCVLAAAREGERLVIIAVLGCPERGLQFADAAALLDRYTTLWKM